MGLIPDETIAQIIDRTDIVEVISSYIPLKQAGRNFKANCPFHNEKTPSFVVNPDKQIFHCFGCGVGGNVISFVMKQDHLEFPEAVRLLAHKANVEIAEEKPQARFEKNERQILFEVNRLAVDYFQKNLLSDKNKEAVSARDYLKSRDVSLETAKTFQLGLAFDRWDGLINALKDKNINLGLMEKAGLIISREKKEGFYDRFRNRIIFPILDTRENVRAFGARALDDSTAKYINSPETKVYTKGHHLYGFHLAKQAIGQDDFVIVVEGYMDCLIPWQHGVKNIVASLGTALTVEQIRLIRRYTKNIVMLFDTDQAGIAAMNRSLSVLLEEGMNVKVAQCGDGEDPDSFIRTNGVDAFIEQIKKSKQVYDYKFDSLAEQHDVKTPQGKAKIVSEMLPIVYQFPNAIEKSEYRKKLAQQLDIAETVLIEEYKKLSASLDATTQKYSRQKDVFITKQIRAVERNILRLLLHDDQFVEKTKEEIRLSDFEDNRIRSVISKIFELFDQGQEINEANLINNLDDKQLQQVVSELMIKEEAPFVDKDKMHSDYIARLKDDRNKTIRKELLEELKKAELSGDHEKVNELTEKFNNIIK